MCKNQPLKGALGNVAGRQFLSFRTPGLELWDTDKPGLPSPIRDPTVSWAADLVGLEEAEAPWLKG